MKQTRYDTLNERERETLKLLAQGLTVTEISQRMSVSESEVAACKASVLRKLGIQDPN